MRTSGYCDIVDVCTFLAKYRMDPFTSYGANAELVQGADGSLIEMPALKPSSLFRGQTKAFDTLRPSIYRKYPPHSTWQSELTLQIDNDSLLMPHPHYSEGLERDFYFSCIKAAEIVSMVKAKFPDFPREVDGHALCQHYGLPTHFLDFSENVWVSGFFASHTYHDGSFVPCKEGIGVVYVLEINRPPPGMLYEIGVQPLPRPFAQRGSLLRVNPEVNLLAVPAVRALYFQHSERASKRIGEQFDQGSGLVPHDEISVFVESHLSERTVTAEGVRAYLSRVPPADRETVRLSIERLFKDHIPIESA